MFANVHWCPCTSTLLSVLLTVLGGGAIPSPEKIPSEGIPSCRYQTYICENSRPETSRNTPTVAGYTCFFRLPGVLWRMDYRFEGKRKTLSFGSYPAVGLKDARARHEEAKKQLAAGIGPLRKKAGKVQAAIEREGNGLTFEAVARDWFSKKRTAWTESHQKKILSRLENQLFPHIGNK